MILFFLIRHMNTIELQLEVTRFLHRCENAASSKALQTGAPPTEAVGSSPPPTLFGGSAVKVEVACKVESCCVRPTAAWGSSPAGIWVPSQMCLFPIQVMLGGKNIEEGFGIAFRVIQVSLRPL